MSVYSIFSRKKEKKIASDNVTVVDDPTMQERFGSYRFDDEGVKSKKTNVIEKGMLKNLLHTRETASRMDVPFTGNGRAQSYGHRPIVRMSNTYFKQGDTSKGEILEPVVPIPADNEQEAIAYFLNTADRSLRSNEMIQVKLKNKKAGLAAQQQLAR